MRSKRCLGHFLNHVVSVIYNKWHIPFSVQFIFSSIIEDKFVELWTFSEDWSKSDKNLQVIIKVSPAWFSS